MKRILLSIPERIRFSVRWLRGFKAGIALLRDPNKLDEVFALDRAMPEDVRRATVAHVSKTAEARSALRDRHRIHVDLERLRALAPGTFGRAVAEFFDENGLRPSAIPKLAAEDDAAYVQAHLYETHDIWHVALGFGTTVSEEIGLQVVYAAQLPGKLAPLLVAGGLLQAALWVEDDFVARVGSVARGWNVASKAVPLFGIRWDEMWELPLEQVRSRVLGEEDARLAA